MQLSAAKRAPTAVTQLWFVHVWVGVQLGVPVLGDRAPPLLGLVGPKRARVSACCWLSSSSARAAPGVRIGYKLRLRLLAAGAAEPGCLAMTAAYGRCLARAASTAVLV